MKKIFKIFILLSLVLLFSLTYVDAFNINMNLEDYTSSNTSNTLEETLIENETLSTDVDNTTETDISSPRVTTVVSEEDEFFTVENILSIIIIVIGILLIFLAIAILIRFK